MADRFLCANLPTDGNIVLSGDESRHLARVARRVVGDQVEIFDGQGRCFLARVREIAKDRVELDVIGTIKRAGPPRVVTLLVATPKGGTV